MMDPKHREALLTAFPDLTESEFLGQVRFCGQFELRHARVRI